MDKDKRKKSIKDSIKSRIASINRAIVSPKYVAKEAVGARGKIASILKKVKISNSDLKKLVELISKEKKKGKPHLKHGGKAKKKYGVVGKPRMLKKGGKA